MANETNTGWVRLYRSTLGWEWFDDPLTLQLWVVCLLKANYLPTRWRGVEIERGAFVTSVDGLCAETGQTTRQIRTRLARLQASGEISVRATNYKSIITVCKFDTYQPLENENDKRPTNSYEGLRRVPGKKAAKIDKPNDKPETPIININTDDYSDNTEQNDKQNDNQSTNDRQTQLFSSDNSIRIYKEEYKELKESLSSRARAKEAERETFFEIFFSRISKIPITRSNDSALITRRRAGFVKTDKPLPTARRLRVHGRRKIKTPRHASMPISLRNTDVSTASQSK